VNFTEASDFKLSAQ